MLDIVLGAQYGDEGKGRIVDYLCSTGKYDVCARVNGSDNAGHTATLAGEKFAFNQIPIGAFHGMRCVIARGCIVDLEMLELEIERVEEAVRINGLKPWDLWVDERCHIKTRVHRVRDLEEEENRVFPIGTTLSGNGPAHADKYARHNVRFCDVDFSMYHNIMRKAKPVDTSMMKFNRCLVEGAHGIMLDIDHGTYPFVTSSACTAAAACHSLGVSPELIDRVIGVIKPYITRVGAGAFPTEIEGAFTLGMIRGRGKEYGTNTKRARRIAWLDLSALDYARRVAGLTEIAICKTDIPRYIENSIWVATGYKGLMFGYIPARDKDHGILEPIYETIEWGENHQLAGIVELIRMIKAYTGLPVTIVTDQDRVRCDIYLPNL